MAKKFIVRSSDRFLSTNGTWIDLFPGYRVRLFDSVEEADAAKPVDVEDVEVMEDPRLAMPVGPYNVLVRTGFMGKSGLVPLQNEDALRFDDVESALAAADSAGFGTDTVRVVPCRMVFAR